MTIELTQTGVSGGQLEDIASFLHGVIGMRLGKHLAEYVDNNKLGYVVNSTTDFRMNGTPPKRQPDVAFVSLERMPDPIDEEAPFAPDLAAEVISRTDDWSAIVAKAQQYLASGVKLIWSIDPYTKGVFVFRPGDSYPQILKQDDELDGETVVPGFKLKVRILFTF